MRWLLSIGLMCAFAFPLSAQEGTPIKVSTKAEPSKEGLKKKPKPRPKAKPKTIRIRFGTVPKGVNAAVIHGRKTLGVTPFTHEFKYDSGPVDVVFRKEGYLSVNTRVFTYRGGKLIVKMTPEEEANTVYGYKEEIPPDAGVPPAPDAGTPPPATPAVLPTPSPVTPTPTVP